MSQGLEEVTSGYIEIYLRYIRLLSIIGKTGGLERCDHAIDAMPQLGLKTCDLGPGHEHYKRLYSLSSRPVSAGVCFAAGTAATLQRATDHAWTLAGAQDGGMVGRIRRRLEVVLGRLSGFADTMVVAAQ